MPKYPKFGMAFNIGKTNEERIEAFELYQKAFNAKKISESTLPDGNDIHIMMEINGFEILLVCRNIQTTKCFKFRIIKIILNLQVKWEKNCKINVVFCKNEKTKKTLFSLFVWYSTLVDCNN